MSDNEIIFSKSRKDYPYHIENSRIIMERQFKISGDELNALIGDKIAEYLFFRLEIKYRDMPDVMNQKGVLIYQDKMVFSDRLSRKIQAAKITTAVYFEAYGMELDVKDFKDLFHDLGIDNLIAGRASMIFKDARELISHVNTMIEGMNHVLKSGLKINEEDVICAAVLDEIPKALDAITAALRSCGGIADDDY